MLQHFFAEFSDPEDQYDLAQLLQTSHKLSTMTVMAYYCRLRTLNEYLAWLPGDTPALTPIQLRQAFHDGMPKRWRRCYLMSRLDVLTDSTPTSSNSFASANGQIP
jgi:hypothetical protein